MIEVTAKASQSSSAIEQAASAVWGWLDANADPLGVVIGAMGLSGGIIVFVGRRWLVRIITRHLSRKKIESNLADARSRIRARPLSGLSRLTIGSLFGAPGLRQSFAFLAKSPQIGITEFEFIKELTASGTGRCNLILSDAGMGKSTFAIFLYDQLAAQFLAKKHSKIPIYIDLRTYAADKEFGSREWLDRFFRELDLPPFGNAEYFVILDGLDELLSSRPANERYRTFDPILSLASLVTCRTTFFDRYLANNMVLSCARKMTLIPWHMESASQYVRTLLSIIDPARTLELVSHFERQVHESNAIAAVCSTPLRINMYVEVLLAGGGRSGPVVNSHVSLYQGYTLETLKREQSKSGGLLTPEQTIEILTDVAWSFYSEDSALKEAIPFTIYELSKLLSSILPARLRERADECARELVERSLLEVRLIYGIAVESEVVRFAHKSFQDFLVARYLSRWAVSGAGTEQPFRRSLNPEVSEFLKEILKYLAGDSRLCEMAVSRIKESYRAALEDPTHSPRQRVEIQQLAYYLGSINHPMSRATLRELASIERDPWVRRGIVIGLAFNGDPELLSEYVRTLREERASGQSAENNVNLGFHLSFFGDQPFDPMQPYLDLGQDECTKTIERLSYQLTTDTDRPNSRLNLYTLIDLYQHRPASKLSAERALRSSKPVLISVLEQLRNEPVASEWPEVGELYAILENI